MLVHSIYCVSMQYVVCSIAFQKPAMVDEEHSQRSVLERLHPVAVLGGASGGQCPRNSESGPHCGPPEQGACINNKMTDVLYVPLQHKSRPQPGPPH